MHFDLVDRVLEIETGEKPRIVTLKAVSAGEEYLQDHFPTFPVLPGVLMIEAMVQAARRLLQEVDPTCARHVLGSVRALKYGAFVKPGHAMRVEVVLASRGGDGTADFRGSAEIVDPAAAEGAARATCVSGRFSMRSAALGE